MVEHTLLCHLLIFCPWLTIVGIGVNGNTATREKEANDLNVFGLHQLDQVLHYDVDTILVEVTVIAEGEEIEFQALRLHHTLGRNIENLYLCKIGLTRNGTERSELGAIELHPVVILWVLILKGLQHFGCIVRGVLRIPAQQLQAFIFSF